MSQTNTGPAADPRTAPTPQPAPPASPAIPAAAAAPTPQPDERKRGYSKDEILTLLTTVQRTPSPHDKKEVFFDGLYQMLVKLRSRCQEDGATEPQLAALSDTIKTMEDERTNLCSMFF